MRRAVVHDPEHPLGGGVGPSLISSLTNRPKGSMLFLGSQRPKSFARCTSQAARHRLSARGSALPALVGRQAQLAAMASLNGGLLVGRDDVLLGTERLTLPITLVEVQHPPGFMREVGDAGTIQERW